MSRLAWVSVGLALLAGYAWLASQEAHEREATRPEPAPIGVTFDPRATAKIGLLRGGGFDFIVVQWDPRRRQQTTAVTKRVNAATGLRYAFLLSGDAVSSSSLDALATDYGRDSWQRFDGKPLVYAFGKRPPKDGRFSIIFINNSKSGQQYWVANPPNIRYGLITLTPSYVGRGLRIDPGHTGRALNQQGSFADTNRDRTRLLLWHSWNVRTDGSAIASHPETYERVKAFNGRWKRP